MNDQNQSAIESLTSRYDNRCTYWERLFDAKIMSTQSQSQVINDLCRTNQFIMGELYLSMVSLRESMRILKKEISVTQEKIDVTRNALRINIAELREAIESSRDITGLEDLSSKFDSMKLALDESKEKIEPAEPVFGTITRTPHPSWIE